MFESSSLTQAILKAVEASPSFIPTTNRPKDWLELKNNLVLWLEKL